MSFKLFPAQGHRLMLRFLMFALALAGGIFIFQFATATKTVQMSVLALQYFPVAGDGTSLDERETGFAMTLEEARRRSKEISDGYIDATARASMYIQDPSNVPYLHYNVAKSYEYLQPLPRSAAFPEYPDYFSMLGGVNVCDWVDTKNIREVWIWRYHDDRTINLHESNMSMGSNSREYWNHGAYGDFSNSSQAEDLPVCEHSYTVYEFNYSRDVQEALENRGHQMEVIFGALDRDLFEERFVKPFGDTKNINNCGNIHIPPNATADYDWGNPAKVLSRCSDWHPDSTGKVETVSCQNWSCDESEGGRSYKVWWMQRIPGRNNTLLHNGKKLRNWWEFIVDFDSAIERGFSLTENKIQ